MSRQLSAFRFETARPLLRIGAVVALLATVPPATLCGALASAAGIVFEATPFVLAARLVSGTSLRWLAAVGSCGCVRGLPGALSLPAAALCWLSFGPWVAAARLIAGVFAALRFRRASHAPPGRELRWNDIEAKAPFDQLSEIALAATAASIVVEWLRTMGPAHLPTAAAVSAALLSGAAIGIALPCTTAAVAIAAALRSTLPAASGAIVATAGFLPASLVAAIFRLAPNRSSAFDYAREPRFSRSPPNPAPTSGWFPSVLLATACAILVLRGGAGLVSPRLVPVVAAGVPLSILSAVHANAGRTRDWLLPAGLLAALALGSPPPTYDATETTLADAFPGERITFTGVVHRSGTSTILQRYVITCCRADAVPVAVRTHRPLPAPDGTWLEARGSIVSGTAGFELAIERWTRVPPPADPFTYR